MPKNKFFRYCYLNTYAFLLLFLSILAMAIPLFKISVWFLLPQGIVALYILSRAAKLFSTWPDKNRKYAVLYGKNKDQFNPETFKPFMQMPCGRLLTKVVLSDLGKKKEYRALKKMYKPSLIQSVKNAFAPPTKTAVYINEDFLKRKFQSPDQT
ncbi:MAG: hypothetical protein K6E22_01860 [Treponema sp.]|nr:hypothetical protein [Treponema sp.]